MTSVANNFREHEKKAQSVANANESAAYHQEWATKSADQKVVRDANEATKAAASVPFTQQKTDVEEKHSKLKSQPMQVDVRAHQPAHSSAMSEYTLNQILHDSDGFEYNVARVIDVMQNGTLVKNYVVVPTKGKYVYTLDEINDNFDATDNTDFSIGSVIKKHDSTEFKVAYASPKFSIRGGLLVMEPSAEAGNKQFVFSLTEMAEKFTKTEGGRRKKRATKKSAKKSRKTRRRRSTKK